jgi:hypothetical protein
MAMKARKLCFLGAIAFAAPISIGHAGPCSERIGDMEVLINDKLMANAAAGPTAQEGRAAGMSVQPTPRSVASAEEKLGEVSPQLIEVVTQAMSHARAADTAGDKNACEAALADAERALGR